MAVHIKQIEASQEPSSLLWSLRTQMNGIHGLTQLCKHHWNTRNLFYRGLGVTFSHDHKYRVKNLCMEISISRDM